jgi:Peptidase family M20/M25/M40.
MKNYLESIAPESVTIDVNPIHGGDSYVCPVDMFWYKAAEVGYTKAFGKKPLPVRRGGSIPVIATFEKVLGIKTVLMGFGLESNAIHSPNENFPVDMFFNGVTAIVEFYNQVAIAKTKACLLSRYVFNHQIVGVTGNSFCYLFYIFERTHR